MKLQKTIIAIVALFIFAAGANAQRQFRNKLDFNGDNRADIVMSSEDLTAPGGAANFFYVAQSPNDSFRAVRWGISNISSSMSDVPTAGDFDGDHKGDFAVIRNEGSQKVWYILNNAGTSNRRVVFGLAPAEGVFDYPVPADYDGDGTDDIAVARAELTSEGNFLTYYWLRSSNGQLGYRQFTRDYTASAGFCTPTVPGDYDGDHKADFVQRCYKSNTQQMYFKINYNATNQTQIINWGLTNTLNGGYTPGSDIFVPGDYDGDDITDLAVVRAVGPGEFDNSYVWYIRRSTDGGLTLKYFGGNSTNQTSAYYDLAAPADYDGDGITDIAVSRGIPDVGGGASKFYFIIQSSQTGATRWVPFGKSVAEVRNDSPLAARVSTAVWNLNSY